MSRLERDRAAALEASKASQAKAKRENAAFCIEVVDETTNSVVKAIDCASQRQADRIEAGLNINLNHERYFTRIVSQGDPQ